MIKTYSKLFSLCLFSLLIGFNVSANTVDTKTYDQKLITNANNPANSKTKELWPVKTTYPNAGALLPYNRIVAYYGNFYSKHMGVLGQYPIDEVISKLNNEVKKWKAADPSTPVIPAVDYIAVVAQHDAGKDGMYRNRMPDSEIQKALDLANKLKGILVLDVQVGHSTLQSELPHLESYLAHPNVMLAIDPEFSMKNKGAPGTSIGTFDAQDVNYAVNFLANIVKKNNLPPKILVVHRFTEHMITNYKAIKPVPEVQIVMDMDGWGSKTLKAGSYQHFIHNEPVQFTGFKLFYQNDLKPPSTGLYTPEEIMKFNPRPIYILYQ